MFYIYPAGKRKENLTMTEEEAKNKQDERRTRFYPYFLIWQSPEKLRELRKPTYLTVNILCPKFFTITAPSGDYTVGEP
jgi:hypothetical protein